MATCNSSEAVHRYHFNLMGNVKEIQIPNKAIIQFRMNGKDERAILLSKFLYFNGKPLDEAQATRQPITDFMKINDMIHFDCHIYDKGNGKDRCNYFAMKAWKHSEICPSTISGLNQLQISSTGNSRPANSFSTTIRTASGWVSEIYPQHGVLTCSYNGTDQRVSFKASCVYLFEKALGLRHNLDILLYLGEQLHFDAVPSETGIGNNLVNYCPMTAVLVWKGKRPNIDSNGDSPQTNTICNVSDCPNSRKGSVDSSSSSSDAATDDAFGNSGSSFLIIPSISKQTELFRGVGMIAKIVNESTGIIWWVRKPNFYNSVWFHAQKTFKYGFNLHDKSLKDFVREGKK